MARDKFYQLVKFRPKDLGRLEGEDYPLPLLKKANQSKGWARKAAELTVFTPNAHASRAAIRRSTIGQEA